MHDNEPIGPTVATGSRGEALSSIETGAAQRLPTVSLGLLPLRSGKAASATWGRVDRLLATGLDLVSATYQPTLVIDPTGRITGGGRQGSAHESGTGRYRITPRMRAVQEQTNPSECVLAHILGFNTIPPMAHLTCIGYRKQETVDIVTHFLRMGVRRLLALCGDPPTGTRAEDVAGELRHASDLIRVIQEIEADFLDNDRCHVTIAVVAYPATNDHTEAIEALAIKQAAGVDMVTTQVSYDAADYVALTDAASYAGVSIPILPSVILPTDPCRLARLEALTGVRVPAGLRFSLGSASGVTLVERGIGATLDLVTTPLHADAPGLYLYIFNHTRPVLDIISYLRLGSILAGATPDREVRDTADHGYLQATPDRGPSLLRRGSARVAVPSHHPV